MVTTITPRSTANRLPELARQVGEVSANAGEALARLCELILERRERAAFAARAVDAVAEAAARSDEATLNEVVGAPSHYAVLCQMLDQPEILEDLRQKDPLAPARLRGLRAKEQFLAAEGGTFTSKEMAQALGITRQAVDNRRRKGTLIGLELGRRGYAYPSWQVGDRGVLKGLQEVLAAMGEYDAWTWLSFMLGTNVWLDGERPLDVLRRGEIDRVVTAAAWLGEQGAP